jgi:uncharacterized membrane protein YfcA
MDNLVLLMIIGFFVGTFGTFIEAGGGFILAPILLFTNPSLKQEVIIPFPLLLLVMRCLEPSLIQNQIALIIRLA